MTTVTLLSGQKDNDMLTRIYQEGCVPRSHTGAVGDAGLWPLHVTH